tara:strand:- start:28 stop:291 length:264 start_codon:yes stop_codon:yes gene_type:complete
MHKDFTADHLKDAVSYGDLRLSGTKPLDFNGEVVELYKSELELSDLTLYVDSMMEEAPADKLVELSLSQGKALYENHPLFKPDDVEG